MSCIGGILIKKYEYYRNENGVLYCGDCLEIMPYLEPVDLVLTDPPYIGLKGGYKFKSGGVAKEKNKSLSIGNIWNANNFWYIKLPKTKGIIRYTSYGGLKDSLNNQPGNLILVGAWHKNNSHYGAPTTPHYSLEFYIGTYLEKGLQWRDLKDIIIQSQDCGGCITRGERIKNKNGSNAHPAQKPIATIIPLIMNGADSILDPFLGTGTTAVACERLNRRWIGIEIEEKYCEIAKKRIEKEHRQLKLF